MTDQNECKHEHTFWYDFGESGEDLICKDCWEHLE